MQWLLPRNEKVILLVSGAAVVLGSLTAYLTRNR